jgi:hypothetical protein
MDEHGALVSALCVVKLCQVLERKYQSMGLSKSAFSLRTSLLLSAMEEKMDIAGCGLPYVGVSDTIRSGKIPAVYSDSSHLSTLQNSHW